MALDSMVDRSWLNSGLTDIANAIREKSGTSQLVVFPDGFVEAIANISGGGGSLKYSKYVYSQSEDAFLYDSGQLEIDDHFNAFVIGKAVAYYEEEPVTSRIYGVTDNQFGDNILFPVGEGQTVSLIMDSIDPNESVHFSGPLTIESGEIYFIAISGSSGATRFKQAVFSYDSDEGVFVQESGDKLEQSEINYIIGNAYNGDNDYTVFKQPSTSYTISLIYGPSDEPVVNSCNFTYLYNEDEPNQITIDGLEPLDYGRLIVFCSEPCQATGESEYKCAKYKYDADEELLVYDSGDDPSEVPSVISYSVIGSTNDMSPDPGGASIFNIGSEALVFSYESEFLFRSPFYFDNDDPNRIRIVNIVTASDYLTEDSALYLLWQSGGR